MNWIFIPLPENKRQLRAVRSFQLGEKLIRKDTLGCILDNESHISDDCWLDASCTLTRSTICGPLLARNCQLYDTTIHISTMSYIENTILYYSTLNSTQLSFYTNSLHITALRLQSDLCTWQTNGKIMDCAIISKQLHIAIEQLQLATSTLHIATIHWTAETATLFNTTMNATQLHAICSTCNVRHSTLNGTQLGWKQMILLHHCQLTVRNLLLTNSAYSDTQLHADEWISETSELDDVTIIRPTLCFHSTAQQLIGTEIELRQEQQLEANLSGGTLNLKDFII